MVTKGGCNIRIRNIIISFIVFVFFLPVLFAGVASAEDVNIVYIISPDTLMLNSNAPYFEVEIDNSNPEYYDVHNLEIDSVKFSIKGKDGYGGWFELDPVKDNPEINEYENKLVLMYNKKDLYYVIFDNSGMTALDYFKYLCEADGTGDVDFKIKGNFVDGKSFTDQEFTVNLMVNMKSGKSKPGK